MYRIDNSSSSNVLDPPSIPGPRPNHYFSGGNPAGGIQATILEAEFMNMLQEELANIVIASGLVLDKADRSQVLKAIRRLFRMRLSGPLDLYVSPSGNDAGGDGLSPATAWRTLQVAWNWMVANLDPALNVVTVHVAPGTYPPVVITGTIPGVEDGTVQFIGNPADPTTTIIHAENAACVYVQDTYIGFFGFTLTATGSGTGPEGMGFAAGPGSTIMFNHINFGACQTHHMFVEGSGSIWTEGGPGADTTRAYTISGGSNYHIRVIENGFIAIAADQPNGLHVNIINNPHFAQEFISAELLGGAANFNVQWNGPATGKRFNVSTNSVVNIGGRDPQTYYPGTIAGTTSTGGLFA